MHVFFTEIFGAIIKDESNNQKKKKSVTDFWFVFTVSMDWNISEFYYWRIIKKI